MKTCGSCGAVLSRTETQSEDIIGQEHAKRALEVALAGNHTIAFFGNEEAEALAGIATRYGLTAWAMQTCPCGYYGFSPHARECACSLSQVNRWQKRKAYQNAMGAEIVIECLPAYAYQIEVWVNGRKGEPEAAMLARVEKQGARPAAKLGPMSKSLLKCAIAQQKLGLDRVKSIIRVTQTIAALGHGHDIAACDLAEAIQYRPRRKR